VKGYTSNKLPEEIHVEWGRTHRPLPLANPLSSEKALLNDKIPGDAVQLIHRVLFLSQINIYISISLYNIFYSILLGT
jgi:hypothetical protein